MSLKVVNNIVTWKENTKSPNGSGVTFAGYNANFGPLFNRIFEFEEISGLKFSAKLRIPSTYELGPIFEINVIDLDQDPYYSNFVDPVAFHPDQ